ncbi:hypothetical protein ELI_1084 [Eubacterium callanderi]|uniref:Uncharacterized protein n=1 Tax=Eubacterium callanderi TaxID=53442 RepID=E3GKN4_9FIRM|nr:hypothetical protein ELI_1084 [Eubacterium callanderi]
MFTILSYPYHIPLIFFCQGLFGPEKRLLVNLFFYNNIFLFNLILVVKKKIINIR